MNRAGTAQEKEREKIEKMMLDVIKDASIFAKSYKEITKIEQRQFLEENIMSYMTNGMTELINIKPPDPIDFLADYLYKESCKF